MENWHLSLMKGLVFIDGKLFYTYYKICSGEGDLNDYSETLEGFKNIRDSDVKS